MLLLIDKPEPDALPLLGKPEPDALLLLLLLLLLLPLLPLPPPLLVLLWLAAAPPLHTDEESLDAMLRSLPDPAEACARPWVAFWTFN